MFSTPLDSHNVTAISSKTIVASGHSASNSNSSTSSSSSSASTISLPPSSSANTGTQSRTGNKVIIDGRSYKLLPQNRLHIPNTFGDKSYCLVDEEGDVVPVDEHHYAVLIPGAWYTTKSVHELHGSLHDNFWKTIEQHVRSVLAEEMQLAKVSSEGRRGSAVARGAARGMLGAPPRQRYTPNELKLIIKLQARWRGAYVRKAFQKNYDERRRILMELSDAEEFYVGNMDILLKFYQEPLRQSRNSFDQDSAEWERALSEDRVDLMFSEVRGIYNCHEGAHQ